MGIVSKVVGSQFISERLILADSASITPAQSRDGMIEAETFVDWIPLHTFRVWDTGGQLLPATAAADDLAFIHGTFGTEPLHISAGDVMGLNSTRYARAHWKLKDTYVNSSEVSIIVLCGMQTNTCSVSCNIDVECYFSDEDMTVTGDRCATAAQTMNSTTFADKTFVITPTSFTSATELDIRLAIAFNDASGAGAREPTILGVGVSQSCKGG